MIIGFTLPSEVSSPLVPTNGKEYSEAELISLYLSSGAIDYFHLRKPEAPLPVMEALVTQIPQSLRKRLILHSHFSLVLKYNLGGYHISRRNSAEVVSFGSESKNTAPLVKTASCHTFEEIRIKSGEGYLYATLSPIFDSISKKGYRSCFALSDPEIVNVNSLMNVIALGGVTPQNFAKLSASKFAGAGLLGYLWQFDSSVEDKITELLKMKTAFV